MMIRRRNMENTNVDVITLEVTEEDFKDPVMFQVGYLNQIPHEKQVEVLKSPHKNKVIVCGRRSGKTQMIAGELIRGCVLGEFKKQIVIAPRFKQSIIVFNKILELMHQGGVFEDIESYPRSPYPKIIFKNKNFIDFGSADNPDSLRGEAYDRVFIDESAFIKKGAMDVIKPLTFDTGAPIWETTTPWGKGDIWNRWRRGQKGDLDYGCFHYNYKDNPYISQEGVKEIEKDIKEWGEDSVYVKCEIFGNFVEDRDVYFKQELVESCIGEYGMGFAHPKSEFYLGVDFARMGEDETVMIVIEKDMHGGIRVNFIEDLRHTKLTEAVGRIKMLNDKYNFVKIYLDETGLGAGPTDMLVESFGTVVEGITFTTKSKMDMYSNLKKLMEQGKLKIPNNKKLIYQLLDLRYETMSSGQLKLHHSERGHDDFCDSLALSCLALGEIEEEYVPFIEGF